MAVLVIRAFFVAALFAFLPATVAWASATQASAPYAFASIPLTVSHSPFESAWRRVSDAQGVSASITVEARNLAGLDRLRAVNAWANHAITYRKDADNWGASDYWATAQQTLAKRAGDCEDVAILKMQLLRAAGVRPSQMYLVVGNYLAARRAHALLVVREEGQIWVLDLSTDAIHKSDDYTGFRPMLSFGASAMWVHGYDASASPAPLLAKAAKRPQGIARVAPATNLAAMIAAQRGG